MPKKCTKILSSLFELRKIFIIFCSISIDFCCNISRLGENHSEKKIISLSVKNLVNVLKSCFFYMQCAKIMANHHRPLVYSSNFQQIKIRLTPQSQ